MAESRILPLFPLGTVLFPGVLLPLHIFEERYKVMIRRCLAEDGLLGVVLIRREWEVGPAANPHEVGTIGRIYQTNVFPDGRLNLAVVGERKFRIRGFVEGQPYLQAEVDILTESDGAGFNDLAGEVRARFGDYVDALRRSARHDVATAQLPNTVTGLSYAVAASLHIERIEQQTLLEDTTEQRLTHEIEIIRREVSLLDRLGAISNPSHAGLARITPN